MRLYDLFFLSYGNLLRMKARLVMTVAGVLTGSAAVVLLVALGLGLQRNATDSLGKIGDLTQMRVNPPMGYDPMQAYMEKNLAATRSALTPEIITSFTKIPGVIAASPLEYLRASCSLRYKQFEAQAPIFGIDTGPAANLGFQLATGKVLTGPGQVLLGPKAVEFLIDLRKKEPTAEKVNWQDAWVELRITRYPPVDSQDGLLVQVEGQPETRRLRMQVVGVLQETGGSSDYGIFIALSEVERWNIWVTGKRIDRKSYGYSAVMLKVKDVPAAALVEAQVSELGYQVDTPRKMLEQMNGFFRFIQLALGGIGAIALLVSAFGIANTMVMSIYERTREIGLLKSLGATNANVLAIFLTEAATIGLLGGFTGAGAACCLAQAANAGGGAWLNGMMEGIGPPGSLPGAGGEILFDLPGWLILFAVGFSTLVGMLSGLYPSVRAAGLDPIIALRHE